MLRDAPVTCAWEAKLCADRGKGDDIALCLFQCRYRSARGRGFFFSNVSKQECVCIGITGSKYLITLKTPRMLTSKVFHHALGSFLFSTWIKRISR
jgi:hypothetical protein